MGEMWQRARRFLMTHRGKAWAKMDLRQHSLALGAAVLLFAVVATGSWLSGGSAAGGRLSLEAGDGPPADSGSGGKTGRVRQVREAADLAGRDGPVLQDPFSPAHEEKAPAVPASVAAPLAGRAGARGRSAQPVAGAESAVPEASLPSMAAELTAEAAPQLVGIIQGERPVCIVAYGGQEFSLTAGDSSHGLQVEAVTAYSAKLQDAAGRTYELRLGGR